MFCSHISVCYTEISKGYMLGSLPVYCVVYHVEILQCFAVSIVELISPICCGSHCSQSVFMGRITTLM